MDKIAIIGAGAVGGYYGARLATVHSSVHFLLRSDLEAVRQNGLQVLSPWGDFAVNPVHTHATSQSIGACDLVVIAMKSTANAALEQILPPLLHDRTMLLTLQNGLGNEEFLAERYGGERVLGGKCFVCLNRIAPGVIRHLGHGIITLGEFRRPPQERTHALAELIRESGVRCEVCDDIEEVLWRKLTWNIPFNGLTIAHGQGRRGIDVGQVIGDPELLEITRSLMRETIAIAAAHGVTIPEDYIDFQIERTKPMGEYRPSSLLDFEAGREVEIEPIWGEPLRRARKLGIAAPNLESLYEKLQTRQRD